MKGEGSNRCWNSAVWEKGEGRRDSGVMAHPDDPVPVDDVYFSNDLDEYPVLDRSLIEYERYYDVMGGIFTTMVTSRMPVSLHVLQHAAPSVPRMSPQRACDEIEHASALESRRSFRRRHLHHQQAGA